MSKTTAVYARIDTDLKNNAEEILSKLGITPSVAIQMLYSQIILTGGFPFQPKLPDLTVLPKAGFDKPEITIEFDKRKIDPEELDEKEIYALSRQLEAVKKTIVEEVTKALSDDCRKIILYGSCARGDYRDDSDVDVAILTNSNRNQVKKYDSIIDDIAMDIGDKTKAIVNFVFLPYKEFEERKSWYPFFMNISNEGELLYEAWKYKGFSLSKIR